MHTEKLEDWKNKLSFLFKVWWKYVKYIFDITKPEVAVFTKVFEAAIGALFLYVSK